MKILRITVLILFLLSAIIFAGYKGYETNSKDAAGPEITFENNSISAGIKSSTEELKQGVAAYDEKDGDVTNSVLIEEVSRFTSPGRRIITYAAFDSKGNISKEKRELVYTNYTPPRYSLSKPLRFTVGDTGSVLKYMTVQDCIDGDLTNKIRYEENKSVFGQSEGTFNVEFQVTNSAGDTAYLPTEVEFYYLNYRDQDYIPEILLSEYIVYIKVGKSVDAKSYLQGVNLGKEEYSFQEDQQYSEDESC
jgi:hypothetical protein